MENTTSFDLKRAVQQWRESLSQSPAFQRENLDELESHLRDSVASLQGRGLTEDEAFYIAAKRLGRVELLSPEFCKVNLAAVWRQRALWMCAGMLMLVAGTEWPRVFGRLVLYLGGLNVSNGLLLGYLGVGAECITAIVFVWLFHRAANGRLDFAQTIATRTRARPKSVLAIVVLVVAGLKIAGGILEMGLAVRMTPQTLGQVYLVLQLAHFVWPLILLGLLAVYGFRLLRNPGRVIEAMTVLMMGIALQMGVSSACAAQPANTPPAVASEASPVTMDEAMKLWHAGKQNEAVETFLAVDFSKRQLFPTGSVLNMTEADFIALPSTARDKMSKAMLDDIQTIKLIAARISETAKAARAAQDQSKATLCTSQLKAAGDAFDRSDGLALLKLVGQALKKMAAGSVK